MKPGKRTPGGIGPKEGDMIPPVPGGDGKWRRVSIVQRGRVVATEVWHGDPPPDPKAKKPKPSRWGPVRDTLELSPVVEKFLSWRFQPIVRPTAKGVTPARLDRYIRLALVGKRTNYNPGWQDFWSALRVLGATDEELMTVCVKEFGCSNQKAPRDKRRVEIDFWRKGKKAWFVVGLPSDPDKIELTGRDLIGAVRRAMHVAPLTPGEAEDILAMMASIDL